MTQFRRWMCGVVFAAGGLGVAQQIQPATPLPPLTPPQAGFSFPQRQTLTYDVDWRLFPAGTATIHLGAAGDQQTITATGVTIGALNVVYRVNDRFESILSRSTGCSSSFSKQTVEGRRQVNSELRFDSAKRQQLFHEKNLVSGTNRQLSAPVPPCVSDLLAAIFYIASQPLKVGGTFAFPLADAMRTVPVTVKVETQEVIKTPAGTYKTVRVQPQASAGIVRNRGEIWIWYSDDTRHIPVQMKARLFWGTLTMHLSSIDD